MLYLKNYSVIHKKLVPYKTNIKAELVCINIVNNQCYSELNFYLFLSKSTNL